MKPWLEEKHACKRANFEVLDIQAPTNIWSTPARAGGDEKEEEEKEKEI